MSWIIPVGIVPHGIVKMKKFKVGDRVGFMADNIDKKGKLYYNDNESAPFGVVSKVGEGGSITVKWDKEFVYMDKYNKTVAAKHLMLESECKEEYSRLEAEFQVLENEIKNKMEQAGKLLVEAHDLASEAGKDLAFMDALSPFTNAIDTVGWRSSSLTC
jgi:hypothetical protein